MDNKKLFDICLLLSLLGIFCLALLSENLELEEIPISNITYKMLDQRVKISGFITRVSETPGLYILNVEDNSSEITVIIFKKENISLLKNSYVSIEGSISEYKNQTEIIAKEIILK